MNTSLVSSALVAATHAEERHIIDVKAKDEEVVLELENVNSFLHRNMDQILQYSGMNSIIL